MWSSSDEFLPSKSLFSNPLYNTSFLLTSTSLDMCTESLGSETGCGIDHLPAPPPEDPITTTRAKPKKRAIKHGPAAECFPPPLTSIGGVQVRAHRESGRLVIKACAFSSSSVFQAERGNGRLRLSLVNGAAAAAAAAAEMEMDGGGGYHVIEDGGKVWSSGSRCNGERRKKLQSLQFCVVGV